MDVKVIWSHIKVLRLEYLKKNSLIQCSEVGNSFIDEQNIKHNLEKLSQIVQIISSDQSKKNLSKTDINVGAEMFVALNSCPSYYVKMYWNVIYGPESRIAMVALKILKKANIDFKKEALKIFSKISLVLGFQHIYILGENVVDVKGTITNKKLLQTVRNHPVHILNNEGDFSPSSFIPFCIFGGKYVGVKINEFDKPVCNIFKPRIYIDQLCFETDLQLLKDVNEENVGKKLEFGLTLVLDFNEDRQMNDPKIYVTNGTTAYPNYGSLSMSMHLNTIGKYVCILVLESAKTLRLMMIVKHVFISSN